MGWDVMAARAASGFSSSPLRGGVGEGAGGDGSGTVAAGRAGRDGELIIPAVPVGTVVNPVSGVRRCAFCATDLDVRDDAGVWTGYRREIGVSAHDYIQFWKCPDCGGTWNRWGSEDPYWGRAEALRLSYMRDGAA